MLSASTSNESADDTAELVALAQEGDDRAVRELYQRHARYVAAIAYRIAGHDTDLDDIVQDTFVSALKGLGGLKQPGTFRVWIARIAIRTTQRYLARSKRRKRFEALKIKEVLQPVSTDHQDHTEVYDVLMRLSRKYAVPWILSRVIDLSLAEVSEICSHSIATTKRRIARAEKLIKRRLDDQ